MNKPVPISAIASQIPPAPVLAVLSRYRREDIEAFIAIAIDLVDLADGDPDLEDATDAEDEGLSPEAIENGSDGPGCILMDNSNEDDREDDRSDWEEEPLEPDRVGPTGMQ